MFAQRQAVAHPIRLGAVRDLNARPLYHQIENFAPNAVLSLDIPARLSDSLSLGTLDVALIPSIEYYRGSKPHGYKVLPGIAIAACGPVRSVKLLSRVPFHRIQTLALDEASRTSQALSLIWLNAAHRHRPESLIRFPLNAPAQSTTADALLLIGDRAMLVPKGLFPYEVDLAEAWYDLTGYPFVFALWVARQGVDLGSLPEQLARCRDHGVSHARAIAETHGSRLGLDTATALDYLTNVLSYDLGPSEIAGLTLFSHLAANILLAPGDVDLVFYNNHPDPAAVR